MTYQPMTPFRRAADLAQIRRTQELRAAAPGAAPLDKWEALRLLRIARTRIGVTDRQLTVLQALLSFVPGAMLRPGDPSCTVHPANATICDRLNGMPCSTMRRHLAALVDLGLVVRHDSPNGKRFVRRRPGAREVFGLDLSPLALRADELRDAAEEETKQEHLRAELRQDAILMRRDLTGLLDLAEADGQTSPALSRFAALIDGMTQALRRKLTTAALTTLCSDLRAAIVHLMTDRKMLSTAEVNAKDTRIEQHHQTSKEESIDLAANSKTPEDNHQAIAPAHIAPDLTHTLEHKRTRKYRSASLPHVDDVVRICSEAQSFLTERLQNWSDIRTAAERLYPMLGIRTRAWQDACASMGVDTAAMTVLAIVQRSASIHSPAAYLNALSNKAGEGWLNPLSVLRAAGARGVRSQL